MTYQCSRWIGRLKVVVNLASMPDPYHDNDEFAITNLVDDSVVPNAGSVDVVFVS